MKELMAIVREKSMEVERLLESLNLPHMPKKLWVKVGRVALATKFQLKKPKRRCIDG